MKIKVQKEALQSLLSKIQNIVERKTSMQVLVHVLMVAKDSKLQIYATNLEVSLTSSIDAEIIEPGTVAIHAKSFFDLVRELPSTELVLEKIENSWLKLKQGPNNYKIAGVDPSEYPVFPEFKKEGFHQVDPQSLGEMIQKTIYSVANDEARFHLNGVYFEIKDQLCKMVSTDGHRLSYIERKLEAQTGAEFSTGVIIPKKGILEIKKLVETGSENMGLLLDGAQIVVQSDETVLLIRLIEGKYPNFEELIPKPTTPTLKLTKEALGSSLKRVALLTNQTSMGVTFNLDSKKIELLSSGSELGQAKENVEGAYTGDSLSVGYNAKYILDVLSVLKEDQNLNIFIENESSPTLIQPDDDSSYSCVVMPMRV